MKPNKLGAAVIETAATDSCNDFEDVWSFDGSSSHRPSHSSSGQSENPNLAMYP